MVKQFRFLLFFFCCMFAVTTQAQNKLDKAGLSNDIATTAYSLRQLSSTYMGPLVRINIGGNSYDVWPEAFNGIISTSSIISSANPSSTPDSKNGTTTLGSIINGSTNASVSIWYDQSGSGYNLTQSNSSLQPSLISSGSINTVSGSGRPSLYFGTANLATVKATLFPSGTWMSGVAKGNSSTSSSFVTKSGTSSGSNTNYPSPFDFTNSGGMLYAGSAASQSLSGIGLNTTNPRSDISGAVAASVYSFVLNPGQGMYSFLNGSNIGGAGLGSGVYFDGGNSMMVGNRNDGGGAGNFWTPELILFNNNTTSSANLQTLVSNQKGYFFNYQISITGQPATTPQSIVQNGSATALSVSGSNVTSYQWYSNTTASNTGGTLISGATNASYTPATSSVGTLYYYCVVSNGYNNVASNASGAVSILQVPTIGTLNLPSVTYLSTAPFTLTAPTSNSTGAFSYTSSNTAVATVSGNTVTIVGAGSTTVTATQVAAGNYTGGSVSALLTVSPPPAVSSFSPSGACAGTTVTITGTNFTGATEVKFGNIAASSFSVVSATSITAVVPANVTTATVSVTSVAGAGTSSTSFVAGIAQTNNFAYTPNDNNNTISIVNTTTIALANTISLASTPKAIAVSPDGTKLYVTGYKSPNAYLYTYSSNGTNLISTMSLSSAPSNALIVSLDGNSIYVGDQKGNIYVVNANTNTVTKTITSYANLNNNHASSFALTPDGKTLYVTISNVITNTGTTVGVINTTTNSSIATITVGLVPSGIKVSPDGTKAIVANLNDGSVSLFNTSTNAVYNTITGILPNASVCFNQDGSQAFVSSNLQSPGGAYNFYSINTSSGVKTLYNINTSNNAPLNIDITPDGNYLVLWNGANLYFRNSSNFRSIDYVQLSGTGNLGYTGKMCFSSNAYASCPVPPAISSFTPTIAGSSTTVTISGSNFTGTTAVSFGGTAATSFAVVNDNTITAIVGNGASGSISVTTSVGTASLAGFTYCSPFTASIDGTTTGCGSVTLTASGGITYSWNGGNNPNAAANIFANSGNYTVTATNSIGCTTTANATVTVNNATTSTSNVANCGSYTWNGTTYTTSGTYTKTGLTNATGCDSTATLVLTITANAPTIGTLTLPSVSTNSAPFTLTAPTSNSMGVFTYTSSNTSVATVSGSTVTIVGAGTATITATQAANGCYTSGSVSATLTVTACTTTYTPSNIIVTTNFTGTFPPDPSGTYTPSGLVDGVQSWTNSNQFTLVRDKNFNNFWSLKHPIWGILTASHLGNSSLFPTTGWQTFYGGSTLTFSGTGVGNLANTKLVNASISGSTTACNNVTLTASGGSSYVWSGGSNPTSAINTIATSGIYNVIASNSIGCKDTASATVTVNNPSSSTTTVSNCINYTWNGTTYTSSGTYTKTLVNAVGCDSTATLVLTIAPIAPTVGTLSLPSVSTQSAPFTLTAPTSNSTGAFTYSSSNTSVATVSGSTITIIGAGTATITASQAANGCYTSGIVTATLTVINCYVPYTQVAINVSGMTFNSLDNGTYSPNGTRNGAQEWKNTNGRLLFFIGGDWVLTGSNFSVLSRSSNGSATFFPTTGWSVSGFGNPKFTGGVGSLLGVDNRPSPIITGTTTGCNNVTLTATGGNSYSWTGGNTPTTAANSFTTSGSYTVTATNTIGCTGTATAIVTVNKPSSSTTTVSNCGSYVWNGTTYTTSGTYTKTLVNAGGCDSTATLALTINQPSTSSTTASNCGSYTWNGTTYNASGTYTKTLVNAAGCDSTATLVLTITPCTNTWTGVTSTDWNSASNWSSGVVPTASTDAIIANTARKPVISSTANVKNVTIGIGATLNVSGALQVSGNWVNNGVPALLGKGTVVLKSSSAATLSGYTVFNNLEVAGNYSVGPLAADNILVDSIAVTGILKKTSGTITTNGKVTLKSTASQTALIQENGGTLTGRINVERYIGGASGYHHISSPVTNNTVGNWGKYFPITGANNIATSAAGSRIATLQEYRESANKQSILDSGFYQFTLPLAITTNGKGFTAWLIKPTTTLVSTGTPANGNISVPVTFASNNATTKGWNLIGNPYPSPISWSALRSLNSGVWGDQACYIWKATNGVNGQWQTYNGTVGTNGVGNVIASSQAFFVLLNQSTNLTFNNSIRTTDLSPTFFSTQQHKQLRLQIVNPANLAETDEVVAYTKGGIAQPVASVKPPMPAGATNASLSFVHEGKPAAIEALADFKAGEELALNISTPVAGVYLLKVGEYNHNLPAFLKDAKTGSYNELKAGTEITIATEATTSNTRYTVVFGRPAAAVAAANNAYKVFAAKKAIQVTNAVAVSNAKVVIYNTLGQQIVIATMNGTSLTIPVSAPTNGTYVVKIAGETVGKVIVR